jgi:RNA polymerase sigma-70 factor (ECF subfamily)
MDGDGGSFGTSGTPAGRSAGAVREREVLARRGAARWPDFGLDPDIVVTHFRRVGVGEVAGDASRHAGDLYLACACLERIPRALGAFEAEYLTRVPRFVTRIGRDHDFVNEVAQMLRERLLVAHPPTLPRLATYSGRSSLASWVAVCAQRVALDYRRRRDMYDVVAESQLGVEGGPDPEIHYAKRRYGRVFEAALASALSRMPARERVILRLWLYEQLSMERIGAMYGVNVSTVSRWLTRARENLSADIEVLVRERLGVSDVEFASLSRLVRSQLDETVLRDLQRSR